MTQTGLSLGTPQYMAPEQAMGERGVDARADVYALGAVLYEMLAGEPPFTGPTAQAIVARVMTERPRALRAGRDAVPPHVEAAVLRALEKLPADRWPSAAAFAAALAAPASAGATGATREISPPASRAWPRSARVAFAALGAACAAAVALAGRGWLRRSPTTGAEPVRFTVELPAGVALDNIYAPLTITRDGRSLVFRAVVNDTVRLVRRDLDRLDVVPIPGTEEGGFPTVSPDGRWLAFSSQGSRAPGPAGRRPATPVPDAGPASGLDWASPDSLVVAGPELRVIPVTGGAGRTVSGPSDRASRCAGPTSSPMVGRCCTCTGRRAASPARGSASGRSPRVRRSCSICPARRRWAWSTGS
jgi:serine/threonine-protein kinase